MAAGLETLAAEHPGLLALGQGSPKGPRYYGQTLDRAFRDLYNVAQVDVIRRTLRQVTSMPRR